MGSFCDYFFAFFLRVTQPFFEDSDLDDAVVFFLADDFLTTFFFAAVFLVVFLAVVIFYENLIPFNFQPIAYEQAYSFRIYDMLFFEYSCS